MMTTVQDLLKIKGNQVWAVAPGTTVLETLKFMADKGVGALLVVDSGQIKGIISERDFVRSIAKTEQVILESAVQDYMTRMVITVTPQHSIDDCMQLMTLEHIRHLPVVDQGKLVGVISVGDVVKQIISIRESKINSLESFIEGRGFGN
jgi:CBS domain-containing protein